MLKQINEHLTAISSILGALAVLLGFRRKLCATLYAVYRFLSSPMRVEKQLDAIMKRGEARERELKRISYALFNGGSEGIVQQVARLSACHSANFESAPYPSFEYTSGGDTTRVNEAYRILVGAWHQAIIGAGRWQQAVTGPLAEGYIEEQERCAQNKEDFIGVCDFKNPMTDAPRGRWRVHAPAAQIGNDCLYVGRFVAALDDKAREIAMEQGWNVKLR